MIVGNSHENHESILGIYLLIKNIIDKNPLVLLFFYYYISVLFYVSFMFFFFFNLLG
jgi:hypothetical protein